MAIFLKGKIISIFKVLVRLSPLFVALSMLFKGLFLITQVIAIGIIISWTLGSVNPILIEVVGYSSGSIVYPSLGALGFVFSSISALLSKVFALKSTYALERVIIEKKIESNIAIISGDLKNMVKLMLAIIDNVVPVFLIFCVSIVWVYISPYSLIVVFMFFLFWYWFMRKGVVFSAKKYNVKKNRINFSDYLDSDEHSSFYGVLVLPSYISIALMTLISSTIILSLTAAKLTLDSQDDFTTYLLLLTGISIIQAKSFVGIIQRSGAYNKSLDKINRILGQDDV